MRTLHSAEADVYLDEIYTPLTLKVQSNEDEIIVDDEVTLSFSRVINIIGIAGQGKSTILRKLFLEELKKGERFPFMLELRRIEGTSIIQYFRQQLKDIGLVFNDDDVDILLQSKKIVIMLDGYDEVSSTNRHRMLFEITQLKTRYNCDVIVTTRPGTEICSEVDITNLKVEKLKVDDIISILSKLDKSSEIEELPSIIINNEQLQETLVSPILVNLLYVCYPYLDTVPESVVDFYDKLFITLFSRHDKIKNFNREKYSSIGVIDANKIFNAFCFDSINKGVLEFTEESLHHYIQSALKLNQQPNDVTEQVLKDLVNITCLIQKDGFDKFVFLHKSIQEFHAAKFIASLPHKHKEKFYLKLVDIIDNEDKFDNVLVFLRYIDADDYNSLLVLNYFNKKKLNHLGSESEDIIINAIIQEILEDKKVLFAIQGDSFICDSMQVLEQKNLLSTLSLFKNKTRRSRPEYEEILSNHLFRLEDKTERNDILNIYPVSASELKEAAKDDITDDKVSIKLSDYLTLNKSIEIYSEIIKKEILAFHEEIYKPIYDKGEQVSRILDIDFDM
ncbi:NACHT domain-containing protein [Vibrio fluvialis]|nr:NACHT domain-containing protein [Vibrio fluvialis]MBY7892839.1 NACHT domain-containing protein [Vibrio fluvialis]